MAKKIKILFTGGGSGGHVYPLIAVYEELILKTKELNIEAEYFYMGPNDKWAEDIKKRGIKTFYILSGKLRRYFSLLNFLDFFKIFLSIFEALFKVFFIMPDVVFSKGGVGALPVIFAAWFYRIPIIIHESDAKPGLTNLTSSLFAKKIAISFENSKNYFNPQKIILTGNPIRNELLNQKVDQKLAKQNLGFNPELPLLFVIGGSQGAQIINDIILEALKELLPLTQILHQTGENNLVEVEKLSRAAILEIPVEVEAKSRYQPIGFLDVNQMALTLSAADLIVSRAGAGLIFEIAAFGKPSIIIPITNSANNHQRLNAYAYKQSGAAVVIEENNLLKELFLHEIKLILNNKEEYEKMSKAALNFSKKEAAQTLALEILKLI
jgi:UDP-N-acetylglucosamine--N-acetylmuramyl-(pentapeptide) pyrophosphoryl-undecaprenol N-acetylglucosamine transferase